MLTYQFPSPPASDRRYLNSPRTTPGPSPRIVRQCTIMRLTSLSARRALPHSPSRYQQVTIVPEVNTISPSPPTVEQTNHPGLRRARIAARVAAENRGRDIVILDLRELTCIFDFFVLVSGTSRRQLHAISEEIDRVLEQELGDRRMGIEGYEESRWILLDYGDVVVHMFEPETRAYYAIEELWGQAKRIPLEEGSLST